jgi:hypothetical protein
MRELFVPGNVEREAAGQSAPGAVPPGRAPFAWPATGVMRVTTLPGGGCTIKITFAERGTVRSIGPGRILKVRNIPTKRIAKQYEILIRHEDDFDSSYNIVDQTPNSPAGGSHQLRTPGTLVGDGDELYVIGDGGFLHFQLSRAGKLVDPKEYIQAAFDDTGEVTHQPPRT